jgi:c-di-GMP-related signal transduction protein
MNPFRNELRRPPERVNSPFGQIVQPHHHATSALRPEFREFLLRPVVGTKKQRFGSAAKCVAWTHDPSAEDPNVTSRTMLDNWLLFGFEELAGCRTVFLNCSRETLLSGFLSLLPLSAVFEVPESLKPDDEVLSVCRSLKAAGYRFALDDFESSTNMEEFLDLTHFIKVNCRHSRHKNRVCMLRELKLTKATLIAVEIESEEEFNQAVEEGFELFQGPWVGKHATYAMRTSPLDLMNCKCILGALEGPVLPIDELAELVSLEPGIECRLLRRANWVTPPNRAINCTRDALEVVEKVDLQSIVTLAITAATEEGTEFLSIPRYRSAMNDAEAGADVRLTEEKVSRTQLCRDIGCGSIL